MELVRTKSGAADAEDFSSSKGSPIVIDEATGKVYVIKVDGTVIEVGAGTYQPLDADLTAIAALGFSASALLKKTAAETWTLDTTAYAPLASPTFTGTPAAPTAAATDDSTQIATTAHVKDYAYSGTYTPTLTSVANLSGVHTAFECQYTRVGDVVTVSGKFTANTITAGTTITRMRVSLPIASAFTQNYQLAGTIGDDAFDPGVIKADATNDEAEVRWYPASTAANSATVWFHFTYKVI